SFGLFSRHGRNQGGIFALHLACLAAMGEIKSIFALHLAHLAAMSEIKSIFALHLAFSRILNGQLKASAVYG
ncbi:hypothetical protein, partial [Paenibacillus sp. DMB5]|uniref:hypothetical protein n=1 Tax=Paenibacillus sp. DMB5 TaxID=1780103 RepID=UPI0018E3772B